MVDSSPVRRVILVVLDGLRADAIPLFDLPILTRLARRGAATFSAQTVSPSVTAAAMTSLLTGVRPTEHGMYSDRFRMPRPAVPLDPMPRVLRDHGVPTYAYLASLGVAYRGLARRFAATLGVETSSYRGENAPEILAAARDALSIRRRGLFLFHWPDADRAGHAHGWTSRPYVRAARTLDDTLGMLDALTGASKDPETLLITVADHGGGGARFRDHDSDHPHDRTIPLVLAGGAVVTGELAPLSSLLDVPPTVLWALGAPVPASYAGRTLIEAFAPNRERVRVPGWAARPPEAAYAR